jgi:exonuclease SbcD
MRNIMPLDFDALEDKKTILELPIPRLSGPPLRILHSSDWHLGRSLLKMKRRHEEHVKFLSWLTGVIIEERIDVLLVAGDVFDTFAPPVLAQELYYSFLRDIIKETDCRNVVVSSGNHDSPSFLNAPAKLLRGFDVYVVSDVTERLEDEVLTLYGKDGEPILIVAAVPFLKDRHVRLSIEGETTVDRDRRLDEGVGEHYRELGRLSEERRKALGKEDIPIVAMGHLFAAGGTVVEGDGTRELYAGGQSRVSTGGFPDIFDYIALGHLHSPQKAGKDTIRYSGAPIPMSFNETESKKSVTIITLGDGKISVSSKSVPLFQRLKVAAGDLGAISKEIKSLIKEDESVWVEVKYTGEDSTKELKGPLDELTEGSKVEIVSIINTTLSKKIFSHDSSGKKELKEYKPGDVFDRLLSDRGVPEEERPGLKEAFEEILYYLENPDRGEENEGQEAEGRASEGDSSST